MSILLSLQIDLLIIYNQDALRELGNINASQMETTLAAEVEESNDILVNSEIDLKFVLVHVEEVRVLPVDYQRMAATGPRHSCTLIPGSLPARHIICFCMLYLIYPLYP